MIGGGPAGLIAAEALSADGAAVTVYEKMPSLGRKLLMAGRGGLNLTHSEPYDRFLERYGSAEPRLRPLLDAFPPESLKAWAEGLGQPLFVGSSGRVFPKTMKASPLLRAWLARLTARGVAFRTRHDWMGWSGSGDLVFRTDAGIVGVPRSDATVLALGGASWPRLGSDGAWAPVLAAAGVEIAPFRPANCGFLVDWSAVFRDRFAGAPLKNIALAFHGQQVRGEAVVTREGLEGGVVYALSAPIRDGIERDGEAWISLDLRPDIAVEVLAGRLERPRGGQSIVTFLRKAAGLTPVGASLLREVSGGAPPSEAAALARIIKALPLTLIAPQPLARAISSAGGVRWPSVDRELRLAAMPDVFVAGEMLDWEAPTGGYLLQACMATGLAAGRAALVHVAGRSTPQAPSP